MSNFQMSFAINVLDCSTNSKFAQIAWKVLYKSNTLIQFFCSLCSVYSIQ